MRLEQVLHEVNVLSRSGPATAEIRSVEFDSRAVGKGSLFMAMRGGTVDGSQFVDAAVAAGAAAVATDAAEKFASLVERHPRLPLLLVPHGREALARLASNLYNHPEELLGLSGVTGTNGKTTTAFLLDAMLREAGRKTVLVGTIEYHVAGDVRASPHTTPESRDLLQLFAEGTQLGATEAVMEVSSHALEQGRVHGLPFDVAIFTNLTQDHLDYHQTMQQYFKAKQRLFDGRLGAPPRIAVINVEDDHGLELALRSREAGAELFSYGLGVGEFRASSIQLRPEGMQFALETPWGSAEIHSELTGRVNVQNMLAAAAAALGRGLSLQQVVDGATALRHVPGRFQTVQSGQPFTVVVDYAHTDDALRNLIAVAREFADAQPKPGRVLTLFGCGGDRDRAKRPRMGKAAGAGSDLCMLTSDNPRSEQPEAILDDVLPGLRESGVRFLVEVDRATAIRRLLREAQAGDIVLIAGKGHEKTQQVGAELLPFDDASVAAEALAALGYLGHGEAR
ncbi:UDP-N-acetylmuramoyl-L-alanyl-D-glutamate--2,6-diaminopimelate ligase [Acidipila sp. EB88]|uniref:UDP-N-acetylmuramoyl-L-alanyl-D-glutamate--2, 6-diaminopimelate ligase n=1 Tax=Acidipila sp. EB88 TaxID=2305226 RepID=UPI000F5F4D73|nr:UDP-N-acetylmuramoyl-L-alanyl-D-glutamate--2,6-diaminopimelate ligase [Acidipila sp. EB88]RRA48870.1 UDP-N-acetylmuramoyl-L-alanyl-D-glutamate--2,6-diaminopimelate ligase [Acidipila sp. EB88]